MIVTCWSTLSLYTHSVCMCAALKYGTNLDSSLEMRTNALQSSGDSLPAFGRTAARLRLRGVEVLGNHVETVGGSQLELQLIGVYFHDHLLEEKLLFGLVEGQRDGCHPLLICFRLKVVSKRCVSDGGLWSRGMALSWNCILWCMSGVCVCVCVCVCACGVSACVNV